MLRYIHKLIWGINISAYLDDALHGQERVKLERHLEKCKYCREYLDQLKAMSVMLETLKDEEISADMDINIRKRLELTLSSGGVKMTSLRKQMLAPVASVMAVILVGTLTLMQVYYNRSVKGNMASRADSIGEQYSYDKEYEPYYSDVKSESYSENVFRAERSAPSKSIMSQISGQTAGGYTAKSLADNARFDLQVGDSFSFYSKGYDKARGTLNAMHSQVAKQYSNSAIGSHATFDAGCIMPNTVSPWEEEVAYVPPTSNEDYAAIEENSYKTVDAEPLSTLSIDVDTASYSNVRRFINMGQLPPKDAVRIEELINYFDYDYPEPKKKEPFSITTEASVCPWNKDHNLVLIGLQGKRFQKSQLPASNLVFLIDVSGSMSDYNKLPLLKDAFKLMVSKLGRKDKVSIVVYAGAAGVVLDSVSGSDKHAIENALNRLNAGGSTAGGAGIRKAYELAKKNFITGGNNRVILATDGDFNVGAGSNSDMQRLIEEKREDGIFLSCVGFGMGNYKDSKLETLANKGNGNYAYIDNISEARKFFVNDLQANLFTIAKDVKIQIEFNPGAVRAYRLIGYENRVLNKEDFNDDTKDAGELGAGHTVTALYEIIPADSEEKVSLVDKLKYQTLKATKSDDIMTVKLRYKKPQESKSKLIEKAVSIDDYDNRRQDNLEWASAVAEFGLLLRGSKHRANASYRSLIKRARKSIGDDEFGYRTEFISLAEQAHSSFGQPAYEYEYEYESYDEELSEEEPVEIDGYNPWK